MEYALLIYGDEKVWDAFDDAGREESMAQHYRFIQMLNEKNALRGGVQLTRSSAATTVRDTSGDLSVTDGPFAEAGEQLGGFYLIEAADLDEAIALAKAVPEGLVEVRPVVPQPARD